MTAAKVTAPTNTVEILRMQSSKLWPRIIKAGRERPERVPTTIDGDPERQRPCVGGYRTGTARSARCARLAAMSAHRPGARRSRSRGVPSCGAALRGRIRCLRLASASTGAWAPRRARAQVQTRCAARRRRAPRAPCRRPARARWRAPMRGPIRARSRRRRTSPRPPAPRSTPASRRSGSDRQGRSRSRDAVLLSCHRVRAGEGDPEAASDWRRRLVAAYKRDIHALAQAPRRARGGRQVPQRSRSRRARTLGRAERGVEHARLLPRVRHAAPLRGRRQDASLEVTSLISWRGEWYVVHLSGFK